MRDGIENPEAYARAIDRNIKRNAMTTRQRKLEAEAPDVFLWLLGAGQLVTRREDGTREFHTSGETFDRDGNSLGDSPVKHPAGTPPAFLLESLRDWGGLTDGQLAFARKCMAERTETNAARASDQAARDAYRREHAPAWRGIRGRVEGTIVAAKRVERESYSYGGGMTSVIKVMIETDAKALVWTSVGCDIECALTLDEMKGKRVAMNLTVAPKPGDVTFGFGSRPAKGVVLG